MEAACLASVQSFVGQARQQLPALARGLTAEQLQAFLCSMHDLKQPCNTQVEVSLTRAEVYSYLLLDLIHPHAKSLDTWTEKLQPPSSICDAKFSAE